MSSSINDKWACESTYALILCCVAKWVAESLVKSSSSLIALPETPVFKTGLVKVLFVKVCEDVNNTIEVVSDKSVEAIVILPLPSKLWPAIVLAVANAVAVSAFPVKAPTNEVDVILVAPVTTPASTIIVPSNTICCPDNGVIVKSVPAVEEISLPFIVILSTERVVKVPNEVIAGWAAVVTVAAVPDVLPVTSPVTLPSKLATNVPVA